MRGWCWGWQPAGCDNDQGLRPGGQWEDLPQDRGGPGVWTHQRPPGHQRSQELPWDRTCALLLGWALEAAACSPLGWAGRAEVTLRTPAWAQGGHQEGAGPAGHGGAGFAAQGLGLASENPSACGSLGWAGGAHGGAQGLGGHLAGESSGGAVWIGGAEVGQWAGEQGAPSLGRGGPRGWAVGGRSWL